MLVVLLADTHVAEGRALASLPADLVDAVTTADLVLHAGDVVGSDLLDALDAVTPTVAVLGNNDRALADRLPERVELDLDGIRVAMVHDSGARAGRGERLARWFPDADVVVFGHSHLPEDEVGPGGQRRFNPGSPTQRRRAPWRSFGVLRIEGGAIASLEHRVLG